jgi:hypothetical protein
MTLYHGSNQIVETPELRSTIRTLDFGPGFYTSTNEEQAKDFARKVYKREKSTAVNPGQFVSIYEVDYSKMEQDLDILRFESPTIAWFDYVFENRRGIYTGKHYDVIYGPVANDTIYRSFIGYEAGLYTKEQTIELLKIRKLYDQMTFSTEKALSFLAFTSFQEVL